MFEERALLLAHVANHDAALNIYANKLRSYDKAVVYAFAAQ